MARLDEDERMEYSALMSRGRDAERTSQVSWTASGLTAAVLLSWAIGAKSPGLMLPVVFAVACGFYARLWGRQGALLTAGYVEEFMETDGSGARWFSRLRQLRGIPGFSLAGDWLTAFIANAVVLVAAVLAWVYAAPAAHGELMAGIVTGCGIAFGFHSITETSRLARTDFGAQWRQVNPEPRGVPRPTRIAAR